MTERELTTVQEYVLYRLRGMQAFASATNAEHSWRHGRGVIIAMPRGMEPMEETALSNWVDFANFEATRDK